MRTSINRTWRTRWIYIGGVAWRLYERFHCVRAMVTSCRGILSTWRCAFYTVPRRRCRHRCRHRCPFTMGRQLSLNVDRVLRFYLPLHIHLYSLSVQKRMHYVPKPHVACCECREGYIIKALWMYLNSAIVYVPVIQLFGRWRVRSPHTDVCELVIFGSFGISSIMFSNLHNPSNMCGLGASHSAFRQVTGTDASRPLVMLHLIIPYT